MLFSNNICLFALLVMTFIGTNSTSLHNPSPIHTTSADPYNITVAKDGSGDYTTIQAAINASKAYPYPRVSIKVKAGIYKEKVHIYSERKKPIPANAMVSGLQIGMMITPHES